MQRALIIKHVHFEGPGAIATWLDRQGITWEVIEARQVTRWPSPDDFDWLFVMGGPMSARDDGKLPWMREEKRLIRQAIEADRKVVGICLGAQLIASVLGADIHRNSAPEIGWFTITPAPTCPPDIASMFADSPPVLHWHGEGFSLPKGARHLFSSVACTQQGFLLEDRVMGLQCHLECDMETLKGLCEHCADEIVPGTWVDPPHKLMVSEAILVATHQRLYRLLNRLANPPGDNPPVP
ncbi:type 1 glutamine amidotransferase [Isoalcanivorax indicus]|uniref:type 1 glutamine amidotransferase n=1 Tax=Isoalcanivorax indicus TaxID=2202653 RepID=UPI000DB907F9|nr:type 1 glutamine amidotransferase [Isoalcanivorax indicus]